MSALVVARLSALLPELEFSRETHVQWANASPQAYAANPSIGDSAFHTQRIADYDERIAAIKEAIAALSTQPAQAVTEKANGISYLQDLEEEQRAYAALTQGNAAQGGEDKS